MTTRFSRAAAIAAATVAAVVSCSHTDTPTTSGSSSVGPSPAVSVSPSPSTPTKAATPVDVTVAPQGDTTVTPGGPPMRFSVSLVNSGPDLAKVGLVVSLGHCSCGPPGASMMAEGSMHMLDPQSNEWVNVPFVREGTGMDYITANLVPPFPLSHGETVTYQLQMAVNAEQNAQITNGETAINVTLTDPDDPMERDPLGSGSYHPVTVEV